MSNQKHPIANHPLTPQKAAGQLILVLGGARSGKSAFAQRLAASYGRRVAFIATATADDDEMQERIARHRTSRPDSWHTIEEPLELAGAVRRAGSVADILLLDCITLWLANWLARQERVTNHTNEPAWDAAALAEVETLLSTFAALGPDKTLLVVTNEVGLGIVPPYPLGRIYRDVLGSVNQRLAQAADRVYLLIAGIAVDIKRLRDVAEDYQF